MHVFTDSKVALRDAVTRPNKRLSSWELLDGAERNRALKAELDRQRAKAQKKEVHVCPPSIHWAHPRHRLGVDVTKLIGTGKAKICGVSCAQSPAWIFGKIVYIP
jgi:hypothetical protein